MQFFRGTGLHGLTGIPAMRTHQQNPLTTDHIDLIRPLLPFSKASIKDFAKLNGLNYVEDSSNFLFNSFVTLMVSICTIFPIF